MQDDVPSARLRLEASPAIAEEIVRDHGRTREALRDLGVSCLNLAKLDCAEGQTGCSIALLVRADTLWTEIVDRDIAQPSDAAEAVQVSTLADAVEAAGCPAGVDLIPV